MNDLKESIRTVPNFPIDGIQFRDITSLIENPEAFNKSLIELTSYCMMVKATKIIGIESRGFVFGAPIARDMEVPFVMARKPGKLPNETYSKSFNLEYGSTSLEIQKNTELKKPIGIIWGGFLDQNIQCSNFRCIIEIKENCISK